MKGEQIGMLVMAGVFGLMGLLYLVSPRVTAWGLRTRKGQRWVRQFGEQRATTLLRFVVGPLLILLAAFFAWGVSTGRVQ